MREEKEGHELELQGDGRRKGKENQVTKEGEEGREDGREHIGNWLSKESDKWILRTS